MFIFPVSSYKSEHICGRERAGLSSVKEGAIHTFIHTKSPLQLCLKAFCSPVLTKESRGSVQLLSRVRFFVTPWLPCPTPTPRACSNSCPSSQWCHPTISSSVIPFSSSLQSFPASESFPMSQFFVSSGQSIGVSASVSVLPINIQNWFPLGLIGWISLQSKGLSKSLFQHHSSKASISSALSFLHSPTLTSIHDHWKNHSLD